MLIEDRGRVCVRRAHVVRRLLPSDIYDHVLIAGALADNHAAIDLGAWLVEKLSTFLNIFIRVTSELARVFGDERASRSIDDLTAERSEALQSLAQDAKAARERQVIRAESDKAAGWNLVGEKGVAVFVLGHVDHIATAAT